MDFDEPKTQADGECGLAVTNNRVATTPVVQIGLSALAAAALRVHAQVLTGCCQSSERLDSKAVPLNMVVSEGFGAIGTHWPTCSYCSSAMMWSALGWARLLSSESLLYHPARRPPT